VSGYVAVERLDEALCGCRVRRQWRLRAGAEHGYALPDRDTFDQKASDQDWESIFAMLDRQLLKEET
jgi:carboxymethylenebutenolidase